jgi:predicted RNA-binding protein with PIN domain
MPYLVDGNNVMAQNVGWHLDKPAARQRLVQDLVRLVAVERVKVKVVFDGVPDDRFPEGCRFKSVHILFAGPGSDADTRIKEIVSKSSYKRDLVVVSSDKALISNVSRQGARVMASHKFRALLAEARNRAEKEQPAPDMQVDIEDWLDFFHDPPHPFPRIVEWNPIL